MQMFIIGKGSTVISRVKEAKQSFSPRVAKLKAGGRAFGAKRLMPRMTHMARNSMSAAITRYKSQSPHSPNPKHTQKKNQTKP
ncbi:hypothetical protein VNO77_16543 [Canavalia gladiata]|uniref:Uncharacterized protein n=1 Tax=Canavalia gladiata TaxID=3824 RepID=A0AAN9M193_CANGL